MRSKRVNQHSESCICPKTETRALYKRRKLYLRDLFSFRWYVIWLHFRLQCVIVHWLHFRLQCVIVHWLHFRLQCVIVHHIFISVLISTV